MARKKRKKRGYSVGLLVALDEQTIYFWQLYSQRVKFYKRIDLPRKWKNCDEKQEYHYHEQIVDMVRPLVQEEGIKSILLVQPPNKDYADRFLNHIEKHHQWLVRTKRKNQVNFGQLTGNATNHQEVRWLMEKEKTTEVIKSITSQEGELLMAQLEKALNIDSKTQKVFYGLSEIEELIYMGGKKDDTVAEKIDYLLLTDTYLNEHKQKGRVYRLKQITENKGIITKIIPEESPAGSRIQQFGGILAFKK